MGDIALPPTEPPKHDALLRLFAKIEQDPITVHEALEDIRAISGENIRKDIEGLEIRTTARFDTIDARFDTTDARTDARFDTTDARTDARFDTTDARFDMIDARFDTVDARFDALQREISSLRWMIGIGFTLLSIFIAISTLVRG